MAYFKLSLLDYSNSNIVNAVKFLPSVISEFYSQSLEQGSKLNNLVNRKQSFCYTYSESLNLHTNAQKELTFSIDRMVLKDNEWIENPYARYMTIGAQLCLEDQYNNQYFFTIKDIKYTFKLNNLTATITCQDTFSYQLTRQNDGYQIENNKDDEDFIGAKTIDWWVQQKIIPECYISYNYLPLNTGLYLSAKDHRYYTYQNIDLIHEKGDEIEAIIKQPYSSVDYKEYYETFSFSGSGNANSILISLGEQIGLTLNTFEHNLPSSNHYVTYFWFEPEKHEENSGLYYSPFKDVQSFSLSHSGSDLTTVLNVSGKSQDNEVVSLLPEIPNFFLQSFHSQEWQQSFWNANFFKEWIYGRIEHYQSNKEASGFRVYHRQLNDGIDAIKSSYQIKVIDNDSWSREHGIYYVNNSGNPCICLPVCTDENDTFTFSSLYSNYKFFTSNHSKSYITISSNNGTDNEITLNLDSYSNNFYLYRYVAKNSALNGVITDISNYMGQTFEGQIYLQIECNNLGLTSIPQDFNIISEDIYLNWYREPTTQDIEFAKIADQIPWLENKIIDFSYFYKHDILNKQEYGELLNILHNNLRIVNGKLLFYTKEYYAALHKKTEILADIVNQFDMLGATFTADVVNPYATKQIVTDITSFKNAYNNIYTAKNIQRSPLLGFNDTYISYINKYINAEQRFLKNIYNFDEYFNSSVSFFSPSACLYEDRIELKGPELPSENLTEGQIITYHNLHFDKVNQFNFLTTANIDSWYNTDSSSENYGKPIRDIYAIDKTTSAFSKINVVYANCPQWTELKRATILSGENWLSANNILYRKEQTYYRPVWSIKLKNDDYNALKKAKIITITVDNEVEGYDNHWDYQLDEENQALLIWKVIREPGNLIYKNVSFNAAEVPGKIVVNNSKTFETYFSIKENNNITIGENSLFSLKFKSVTVTEMRNHFRALHYNDENKFYKRIENTYNYQPITSILEFYNNFSSTNKSITKTVDNFPYCKNKNKLYTYGELKHTFLKNIPISHYYYKDFNYTITTSDKNIDTYNIVNNRNQTFLEFLLDTTDSIINPFDQSQYNFYELNILNTDNVTTNYGWTNYNFLGSNLSTFNFDLDGYYLKDSVDGMTYNGEETTFFYDNWTTGNFISTNNKYALRNLWQQRNNFLEYYNNTKKYKVVFNDEKIWIEDKEEKIYDFNANYFENYITNTIPENNYIAVYKENNSEAEGYLVFNTQTDNLWLNKYCEYARYFTPSWANFFDAYNHNDHKDKGSGLFSDILATRGWDTEQNIDKIGNNLDISKCYFQDKWVRTLDSNSKLNIKDTYVFIPLAEYTSSDFKTEKTNNQKTLHTVYDNIIEDGKLVITSKQLDETGAELSNDFNGFSQITHYPLMQDAIYINIDTSYLNTDSEIIQITDFTNVDIRFDDINSQNTNSNNTSSNNIFYKVSFLDDTWVSNHYYLGFFGRIEDFIYIPYKPETAWDAYNDRQANKLYTDEELFDALQDQSFCNQFYTMQDYDSNLVSVVGEKFDLHAHYYDNENKRVYTIIQLLNELQTSNFKYGILNNIVYTQQSLSNDVLELKADVIESIDYYKVIRIGETEDDPLGLQLIDSETNNIIHSITFTVPSVQDKDSTTYNSPNTLNKQIDGLDNWTYTWTGNMIRKLGNCTNGEFWYLYHDVDTQPVLFEYAATIAAQLEEYWQLAYTASVYCEYFLPEHWQSTNNGSINYFSNHIMQIDQNTNTVKLSYTFIPHVQKLLNTNNTYANKSYKLINQSISSLNTLDKDNIIKASEVYIGNPTMEQIATVLNIDWNDFVVLDLETTQTYYYVDFGGQTYQNLISYLKIPTTEDFNNYTGLYLMTIKWLQQYYYEYPISTYEQIRAEHDNIWKSIYQKYPGIILEGKYSNTDATTSQELLLLAQNAFKDLSMPERGYSITLINDARECEGYYGQELKIGDSIRVRGNEFYDGFDDISKSLEQLLFITDIKYNLRKDTDISLTVNAIKYQDKLIQRLAKLIK